VRGNPPVKRAKEPFPRESAPGKGKRSRSGGSDILLGRPLATKKGKRGDEAERRELKKEEKCYLLSGNALSREGLGWGWVMKKKKTARDQITRLGEEGAVL